MSDEPIVEHGPFSPVTLRTGDRVRITTAMTKVLVQAVQAGEDHLVVQALEQDPDTRELRLQLARGGRVEARDEQ